MVFFAREVGEALLIGLGTISARHMTVIENFNKLGYKLKVVAVAGG